MGVRHPRRRRRSRNRDSVPGGKAAWAILGQTGWTVGCDTIPKIYLSGGQVNGLYAYERQHAAAGCFYVWPRNHRTWKIKCTNYYA